MHSITSNIKSRRTVKHQKLMHECTATKKTSYSHHTCQPVTDDTLSNELENF